MNASTNLSFEQSFDQLEKILEKMNQPNLTLEESIFIFL
jgi:exodeoxyribonuclease VII small subunit